MRCEARRRAPFPSRWGSPERRCGLRRRGPRARLLRRRRIQRRRLLVDRHQHHAGGGCGALHHGFDQGGDPGTIDEQFRGSHRLAVERHRAVAFRQGLPESLVQLGVACIRAELAGDFATTGGPVQHHHVLDVRPLEADHAAETDRSGAQHHGPGIRPGVALAHGVKRHGQGFGQRSALKGNAVRQGKQGVGRFRRAHPHPGRKSAVRAAVADQVGGRQRIDGDRLADAPGRHPIARGGDAPGELMAQGHGPPGRPHGAAHVDVAEIAAADAAGGDIDQHVVGAALGLRHFGEPRVVAMEDLCLSHGFSPARCCRSRES